MKYYVYCIQHKSGRIYIGSRTSKYSDSTQLFNPNHEKPYYTSSQTVKQYIEEDGIESFKIRKLWLFDDKKQTLDFETKLLKRLNVTKNHNLINNSLSFPVIPNSWKNKTEEEYKQHCENISKGRKGMVFSESHRENMSKPRNMETFDLSYVTDEWKEKKSKETSLVWEKRRRGELPKPFDGKTIYVKGNERFYSSDEDLPPEGFKLPKNRSKHPIPNNMWEFFQ